MLLTGGDQGMPSLTDAGVYSRGRCRYGLLIRCINWSITVYMQSVVNANGNGLMDTRPRSEHAISSNSRNDGTVETLDDPTTRDSRAGLHRCTAPNTKGIAVRRARLSHDLEMHRLCGMGCNGDHQSWDDSAGAQQRPRPHAACELLSLGVGGT